MKIQTTFRWGSLGLLVALLMTSCRDDAQLRAMSEQIRALEMTQNQSKAELSRVQLQMRALQAERDKIKEEKEKLQQQIQEAQRAAESIKKDFEDYKQQYKLSIRKRAPGMELEMVEVDGKMFRNVKIRELTDTQVTFMHASGTLSASLNQLPLAMQTLFGYESGVSVMAKNTASAGTNGSGIGIEQELANVNRKLNDVTAKIITLQRSLNSAVRRARDSEAVGGSDSAVHRQAAAAYQVQINEAEVEQRNLQLQSRKLAEQLLRQRSF